MNTQNSNFSLYRLWAIIIKEFIQIRRDKPILAMVIVLPLIQLLLFGYAINTNPQHLPTAIIAIDQSPVVDNLISTFKNTQYFDFISNTPDEKQAHRLLAEGKVVFVITIPANFSRDYQRGLNPSILVEADATDPIATGNAIAALTNISSHPLNLVQRPPNPADTKSSSQFQLNVHSLYNPLAITTYNIVPGLLGVILTSLMVFITAQSITRERERGTFENLLATPVLPLEVMIGKITPYIMLGYFQVFMILTVAHYVFHVPLAGNLFLLLFTCLPLIAANLAIGLLFSTLANNQLQAIQGATFYFLPSLLISGFMFPFFGMPQWAQAIGNLLPLTHFMAITRGIVLKGNNFFEIWHHFWPMVVFTLVVILIGLRYFRRTLD